MPIQAAEPAQPQEQPYLPAAPKPLVFELWRGVNTNTTRMGVPDEQAFWIDGFFPLSDRKARTMWGVGASIYTTSPGITIVFYEFANIGLVSYNVVFLSDGSVIAINMDTLAVRTLLAPGTILNPLITSCGVSQWSNQYIILLANQANGYWLVDATNVYTAGTITPVVIVTNTGSGYSTPPGVIATGGHGFGTSLVPVMDSGRVISISVVNPGQGYLANDNVSIVFVGTPTGGSGASLVGAGPLPPTATISGHAYFALTSISVVAGGSLYNTPTIVFTMAPGLMLASPIAQAQISNGSVVGGVVTYGGLLFNATLYPTILITETAVTASASLSLMPFGIQGTDAEIYSGHVWVINGPIVYFSAPGDVTNFATSAGGGNFTSTDSTLKNGYTRVVQANGVLYLVGDSSVTYISGVQTTGSPPTTTFTKLVLDPEVGSPYPQSVQTYGRDLMFANSYGIHVVAGAAAVKASEMLDGVYSSVSNFGGMQISAAKATVFGKKVWMELVRIVDPITKVTENKILFWDGKKWFSSLQDVALTFIGSQELNSVFSAWGTNGTSIYPLFNQPSTAFSKRMRSKLWDAPGGIMHTKTASRLWAVSQFKKATPAQFTVAVENEAADGVAYPNTLANTYTFTSPGTSSSEFSNFIIPPVQVGQAGVLTGFTLETSDGELVISSVQMGDEIAQYRG